MPWDRERERKRETEVAIFFSFIWYQTSGCLSKQIEWNENGNGDGKNGNGNKCATTFTAYIWISETCDSNSYGIKHESNENSFV